MKHRFLLITGLLFVQVSFAQTADTLRLIDELFSGWNNATPGGSIVVARGNKIIYHKAFGLANLEHAAPNTTETIFEGGSVSKQFTAAAVLLLEADGKLSLDDDVRKYVPELPVYEAPITIHHLFHHTSGLKDWGSVGSLTGWPRTTRVYTQALALDIICKQKSLNFKPGSEYSYSNSNYTLLVTIVERVSKQSHAEFTKARLFDPLGMTRTKWRNNYNEIIPGRATAYSKSDNGYQQDMPFENVYGHGGILTTTGDLLKWNRILETHELGDRMATLRIQKGRFNNGTETSYAAGLVVTKLNGFDEINHSGATAGYRGWLAYYPQKKLSVAILSNDASFAPVVMGQRVAGIYLGKATPKLPSLTPVILSDTEMKKWPGIYRSVRGFEVFKLEKSNNGITSNGRDVVVTHRDTLRQGNLKWIAVRPNIILYQNNADTSTYVSVKPPSLTPSYQNELVGEYYSEEADARFQVELKGNELWVFQKPAQSFKLNPSFLDGYMTQFLVLYEFKRDKSGKVRGLEVSLQRAERVPFIKVQKK